MKILLPITIMLLLFTGCNKKKIEKRADADEKTIVDYIADHNLSATRTETGLYYVIESQGTGDGCTSASAVRVAYKGYHTNGLVFDESSPAGVEFPLQNVIAGWTEGIPYFKEGGVGKLLLPSALAYGPEGNASIPPNTVLIFDVELIDVL